MQRQTGRKHIRAWSTAFSLLLCALVLCGCNQIEPAPTPNMEGSEPTTVVSETEEPTASPEVSAHRNDQLSQDMFSGSPAGASAAATSSPSASAAQSAQSSPSASASASASASNRIEQPIYMRGAWVATVLNIDYPSSTDPEEQRTEFRRILDNMQSWGLDTAIVQVRPMGDAFYPSELSPWSSFLTGTQGEDPGWDPLEFMIEETHARGMSFHAWLNPYRVTHPSAAFTEQDFASDSLARLHPEWLIEHENTLYLDPAREEIKQHIVDTVKEIVDNYDVDGIHFDDYFYPAGYPLPDGAERDGIIDQERRANINEMLRRVKQVCDEASHPVMFGVSPFGVWKNASTDPAGSDTDAGESYYEMAADSVRWIREGIIDYIAPQLYWPIGHNLADYDTLAHWWAEQVEGTDVSLIIGQGLYNGEVASEITDELMINSTIPQITGSLFFSYSDLADNAPVAQAVEAFYAAEPNANAASSVRQSSASASASATQAAVN